VPAIACTARTTSKEALMAEMTKERPKGAIPKRTRPIDRYLLGVTLFLVAAGASFLLSIGLWFSGSREEGVYVGLWVPSILAAGAFWVSAISRRS
jgi:hypothetical protein